MSVSEYLGVRVAMLDALQRYNATDHASQSPKQKVAAIQELLKKSCQENQLLGEQGEIIGEAWSRFIASRPPAAVVGFIENPEIKAMLNNPDLPKPELKSLGLVGALGLIAGNFKIMNPIIGNFEHIVQGNGKKETILIDYKAGESVSAHIENQVQSIRKERGIKSSPSTDAIGIDIVRELFDTKETGPVKTGLPPATAPASGTNIGHGGVPRAEPGKAKITLTRKC